MRNFSPVISTLSLLFATHVGAAETAIKPGLWEITTTSRLLNLASQLPPDQLEGLNDLAKEYGLDMPEIKNGAAKSNTCITPEMASQKVVPSAFESQAGCTVQNAKRNGNDYRIEYLCKNPQLDGKGVAEGTLTDSSHFTGSTTFNGLVQGNPVNEQANITGKWVNAACGNANLSSQ
jgi:hypothetical protein